MSDIVYVAGENSAALSEPVFIIKVTDESNNVSYYVTRAIWPYIEADAATQGETEGVGDIATAFTGGSPAGLTVAAVLWATAPPDPGLTSTHTRLA